MTDHLYIKKKQENKHLTFEEMLNNAGSSEERLEIIRQAIEWARLEQNKEVQINESIDKTKNIECLDRNIETNTVRTTEVKATDWLNGLVKEFELGSKVEDELNELGQVIVVIGQLKKEIQDIKDFLVTNDKKELFLDSDFVNQTLLIRKSNISFPIEKEKESEEIVKGILRKINEANQQQLQRVEDKLRLLLDEFQKQSLEVSLLKSFAQNKRQEKKRANRQFDDDLQEKLDKQSEEIRKMKILYRLLLFLFLFFLYVFFSIVKR